MNGARGVLGSACLGLSRLATRGWGKAFSVVVGGAFAEFGSSSVIQPPVRLAGEDRIAIGNGVFIGRGSWLQALNGRHDGVVLEVGEGTSIAGSCVLSAACSIRVGRRVLIARNVYVADHSHAFADPGRAVLDQGIDRLAPVEIGDGAWIGQNVVVGPGVRIGRGAVVGANAVVLEDVPDHTVAVGAPAHVVRAISREPSAVH
jgi:acetyltransferase-like isoleucine patch superfamily enzyme